MKAFIALLFASLFGLSFTCAHPIPVADSIHLGNVAIADTTTLLMLDTVRGYEHTLLFNLQNPSADTLYIRKAGTSGNAWSDQMNGFTMPPQSSMALTFTATLHPGAFYKVITFYFTRGHSNKKEEKLNLIYKGVNIAVD